MALENKVTLPEDSQGKALYDSTWSPLRCEKLITFDGGTTDAWGDHDGALDGAAVFTITGTVRFRVIGVVETTLVGAATIELGVTGTTAGLLAQVADASGMAVNEIWHDATVDAKIEASTVMDEVIVANGLDAILTIGAANITAGAVRFLVSWYPISEGALVIPSAN